jgi:hypothetical protein
VRFEGHFSKELRFFYYFIAPTPAVGGGRDSRSNQMSESMKNEEVKKNAIEMKRSPFATTPFSHWSLLLNK